jgi:hypothetical protein
MKLLKILLILAISISDLKLPISATRKWKGFFRRSPNISHASNGGCKSNQNDNRNDYLNSCTEESRVAHTGCSGRAGLRPPEGAQPEITVPRPGKSRPIRPPLSQTVGAPS